VVTNIKLKIIIGKGDKQMDKENKKLGLFLLVALGIGSMIAGGIFNSPTDLISKANPMSIILAWAIGGFGVLMLAFVFQILSNKKPELKGGVYSYAKAGFGEFIGFNSGWGYWLSGFLGNVAFFTIIFKTINSLLGTGNELSPLVTFILGSILLWAYHYMISKGIRNASVYNAIVTVAKVVPLVLVIIFGLLVFKFGLFSVPNWKTILAATGDTATLGTQINNAMGTILWCFVGIEAAVVMSTRAENTKIVGKATVISFLITLCLYMLISIIAMGIVPAKELAQAGTPLADVLSRTVLKGAGGVIVKLGLLISVLGALISWVLLTAEIPYVVAADGAMPKWFAKENKAGVPINSLIFSNGITQVFLLFLMIPQLQKAYSMTYTLSTTSILIPYLLSALYGLKVLLQEKGNIKEIIISAIAVVYALYVIYAVGLKYLALTAILYAIGGIPFYITKKEKNQKFTKTELVELLAIVILGVFMTVMLVTGRIGL